MKSAIQYIVYVVVFGRMRTNASFVRILLVVGIVILLTLTYRNYSSAINTLKNAEDLILKEEEESERYAKQKKV